MNINNVISSEEKTKLITRKQAIKQAGIAALTAASIMFLSTKQSSAASSAPLTPPAWP